MTSNPQLLKQKQFAIKVYLL